MAGRFDEAVGRASPREVLDRFVAAYHARDWLALRDVLSPEFDAVDRRPIGWGSLEGPDAFMKYIEGGVALAPDARLAVAPIVLGGRAVVVRVMGRGHLAEGGGEFEIEYVTLTVVEEGRGTHFEVFPDAVLGDALARFEEIGAQTEPERALARVCRLLSARDWDALRDCYAEEDYELIDRRALGWEPLRGPEAMVQLYRSWVEIVPDVDFSFESVAGDERHLVYRWCGRGTAADDAGGGVAEYPVTLVSTLCDGRWVATEVFDVGDEALALALLQELRADRR